MTFDQASLNLGGAFINQHHIRDFTLGCDDATPLRFRFLVASPHELNKILLKLARRNNINLAVNRFVAGMHEDGTRVFELEHAGYFFRRPAPLHSGLNLVAQRWVFGDVASHSPGRTFSSQCRRMGCLGKVRTCATVAPDFRTCHQP
jgi:hypothetical protein